MREADTEELRERFRELLEELRTVIPGVQVLFAFLLTVPFSSRFDELDDLGRDVFAVVILGVALSTIALLTPTAYHRVAARDDRRDRLHVSVALTIVGMALLAASMVGAIFVVTRFVFDSTVVGAGFAGAATLAVLSLWWVLPAVRGREPADDRS